MFPWKNVSLSYNKVSETSLCENTISFVPTCPSTLIDTSLFKETGRKMYCAPTMIFFMHLSLNWILLIKHWDWTLSAFYRRDKLRIRVVKKYEYLKSCGWHAILGISKSKNYFDSTNINKPFKSTEVMGTIKRTFEEALTSRGF